MLLLCFNFNFNSLLLLLLISWMQYFFSEHSKKKEEKHNTSNLYQLYSFIIVMMIVIGDEHKLRSQVEIWSIRPVLVEWPYIVWNYNHIIIIWTDFLSLSLSSSPSLCLMCVYWDNIAAYCFRLNYSIYRKPFIRFYLG